MLKINWKLTQLPFPKHAHRIFHWRREAKKDLQCWKQGNFQSYNKNDYETLLPLYDITWVCFQNVICNTTCPHSPFRAAPFNKKIKINKKTLILLLHPQCVHFNFWLTIDNSKTLLLKMILIFLIFDNSMIILVTRAGFTKMPMYDVYYANLPTYTEVSSLSISFLRKNHVMCLFYLYSYTDLTTNADLKLPYFP